MSLPTTTVLVKVALACGGHGADDADGGVPPAGMTPRLQTPRRNALAGAEA